MQRGFQLANITLSSHKIAAMPRDHNHLIAKRALADQFADVRGAVMKIGQFLANSETDDAFACLLKGIDSIPLASISPVIEQALNRPLTDVFSSIEESTAARSGSSSYPADRSESGCGSPISHDCRQCRLRD